MQRIIFLKSNVENANKVCMERYGMQNNAYRKDVSGSA